MADVSTAGAFGPGQVVPRHDLVAALMLEVDVQPSRSDDGQFLLTQTLAQTVVEAAL